MTRQQIRQERRRQFINGLNAQLDKQLPIDRTPFSQRTEFKAEQCGDCGCFTVDERGYCENGCGCDVRRGAWFG